MENIWLGRFPKWGLLVDEKQMYADTLALFQDLNLDIDPKALAGTLSVSKIQSMEIAKAVSFQSKVIVMDEPTSSLTGKEVDQLFAIINQLRSRGVSIIYISHKMEEILTISDEVTIMRDGFVVGTWDAADLTTDLIITRMVGRDLDERFPERTNVPGEVILKAEGLTSSQPNSFRDVSFELRKGEVLGIGGLVGAQRTELIESLFGLRGLASDEKKGRDEAREQTQKFRTKTPSVNTLIRNLSGGNQQKVLLARWLLTDPEILLLDEPTRGIDVGAKFEIYTIITELARQGKSIVMISSEMPELLGMSDRIMVMSEGRLTGIVDGAEATEQDIMRLAAQQRMA
ncbi:hypothetical protein G195_001830 [Phytophthora kernoviae 00238/432]|uniref:ABC transporter domain-containing protein n=1 Tax=Phytophthora kernoviae 00238/432 TaxID=1284355 RepID=A0A8J4SF25_9STRA|nr:hypothetical protein G195_001830 [Phytophthora kernoviae 00238/432]